MVKTPTIPTLADPQLMDKAIQPIQTQLQTDLTWLDNIFGKASRQVSNDSGRRVIYPAAYVGGEDYRSVFPDEHFGNFCFFDLSRPERRNQRTAGRNDYTAELGIVFWWYYPAIWPADHQQRTVENVKALITASLQSVRSQVVQLDLMPDPWKEKGNEIYPGYTDKEIQDQYLMRPFGGVRCDIEIKYTDQTRC